MKLTKSRRGLKPRERDTRLSSLRHAPPLIMITDQTRVPRVIESVQALPKGSAVLFRDYELPCRLEAAKAVREVCLRRRLRFLVAGNGHLAAHLRADGIHMPESGVESARSWRRRRPEWFITVAAHSHKSLWRAARAGADAALLSPVFATVSHPDITPMESLKFANLTFQSPLPVYALGGINAKTASRLFGTKLCGIAAVSGLGLSSALPIGPKINYPPAFYST